MAIRKTTNSKSVSKTAAPSAPAVVSSTPVRNSAVPPRTIIPGQAQKKAPPSYDQIARRAYEIWQSGKGGSQDDNRFRAERELRGM